MSEYNPSRVDESVNQRIDEICDAFEKRLQAGEDASIESFLEQMPSDHQELLLKYLLAIELEYKKAVGAEPDVSFVQDRFPDFKSTVTNCFIAETSDAIRPGSVEAKDTEEQLLQAGSKLGSYTVARKLGAGAFGSVYLAKNDAQAEFAIKILRQDVQDNLVYVRGFIREAQRLATLSHPNVIQFIETFEAESGQLCIVTEYASGGALSDKIAHTGAKDGQWEPVQAARCIEQLALALEAIHEAGFVHRDIKPENILLDGEGNPKLADVGLALDEADYGKGERSIAGTVAYLSPEAAKGESHLVDQRADIYGLGLVLYEMLTGRRGFSAETRNELLRRIKEIPLRPVRALNPSVPAELERICLKAAAKDPEQRYFTGGDLAADLNDFIAKAKGRNNVKLLPTAILTGAVLLLFASLLIWPGNQLGLFASADQERIPEPTVQEPLSILSFDVQASRDGGRFESVERFNTSGGLKAGDAIRFSARLNRPGYVKIFWVDAGGKPVEFYPTDPYQVTHGEQLTDSVECPNSALKGFKPLDPAGWSESAFLFVSDKPIEDISSLVSKVDMETVRELRIDGVNRFEANHENPNIERLGEYHQFRGLGGNIEEIQDPTMELLENVHGLFDVVRAVRIPMQFEPK